MASDQQVYAKIILESLLQLKRQGSQRVMEDIEKLEPDLANYLIENLSRSVVALNWSSETG